VSICYITTHTCPSRSFSLSAVIFHRLSTVSFSLSFIFPSPCLKSGISGVDLAVFILAMPAVLPWYLFLVCLGAVSKSMYSEGIQDNVFGVVLISSGVASGIIGLVITWRFAKKELHKDAEVNMWRMVDPKSLPEVGSRSPTPISMLAEASSSADNTANGIDEENPSSNDSSYRVDVTSDIQKNANDDYNDNMIDTDIGNTNSSGSNLGGKMKQVVQKLTHTTPTTISTPPPARRHTSTNIMIEESDLGFADYFRTQVLGEDEYGDNNSAEQHSYRKNLDWTEIILDDFS
jgi:hypothetical protein